MSWQDKVRKRRIRNSQKHKNLKVISTTLESMQSSRSKKTGIKNQPTRLQDYKRVFFRDHNYQIEQDLYVHTHNCIIDIKLEMQSESRKNGQKTKYAKTKASAKVNSYDGLKRKYKVGSLKALELKYRKLIFDALQINSIGHYNGESWVNLIIQHQNVDQMISGDIYPEFKEGIKEQIILGKLDSNNKNTPRKIQKSDVKIGLEAFMIDD